MRRLATKWFGVLLIEGTDVVEQRLFPAEAEALADRLEAIGKGQVLEEERALAGPDVQVADARLASVGSLSPTPEPDVAAPAAYTPELRRAAVVDLARRRTRAEGSGRDRYVAHAVRAMDELTRTLNTLVEQLREWHGLHEPGRTHEQEDQPAFAGRLAEGVDAHAGELGMDWDDGQREAVTGFARVLSDGFRHRQRLEEHVIADVRAVAPALSQVAGELVGARLIAHAGSLDRLAFMPASTVQTLGAENALFAHLRKGHDPPKHGVLFQHPMVNTAPPGLRGRVARVLATKATLAARADRFAPEKADETGRRLRQDLERRVKLILARGPPPRDRRNRPSARTVAGGRDRR
jgi:nucleolar protein 56